MDLVFLIQIYCSWALRCVSCVQKCVECDGTLRKFTERITQAIETSPCYFLLWEIQVYMCIYIHSLYLMYLLLESGNYSAMTKYSTTSQNFTPNFSSKSFVYAPGRSMTVRFFPFPGPFNCLKDIALIEPS